jgi:hypothetical protein
LPPGHLGLSESQLDDLSAVVHRAIACEPEARFDSMQAFARALEPFVGISADGPATAVAAANTWTHRKVDWALARAARLQVDQPLGTSAPGDGGGADIMEQTLSDKADPVWAGLLLTFVIGLGVAFYFLSS